MIFNLWMGFDDLAQSGGAEDSDVFKQLGDPAARKVYRQDDSSNAPRVYELWNLYYTGVNSDQEAVDIRNDINAEFPGQVRTIGGWWFDGRQVGTEWTDNDRLTVTGTPLFPFHASILEYMPDIDDIGTRPTDPSDVNLLAGQAPRRFD